ncbi:PAAR domain-containing protein [Cystobacter ferrugineus]|uniref:PAAR domain-containing protein n=1 Tax=Cystobacter ferrugineus TaxID=83449 RepID=UPI001651595E|nr:PAAR domain-containing protein [Cystobacter ferrugineus]
MGEVLGSLSVIGGSVTGQLVTGSPDVLINGLPAARCHQGGGDSGQCSGMPPLAWPPHGTEWIAQGSSSVIINDQPAARVGDKLQCGATISAGSSNVIIGGPQITTLDIDPEVPDWLNTTLLCAGVGSAVVLAGPVVALMGLAGSMAGGYVLGEAGAAMFGAGSDGQKLMGLVGSVIGGGALARLSVRPAYQLGNKIGGRTGEFVRGGVRASPSTRPQEHAERRASEIREMSKNQQNQRTMTSAAVDRDRINTHARLFTYNPEATSTRRLVHGPASGHLAFRAGTARQHRPPP